MENKFLLHRRNDGDDDDDDEGIYKTECNLVNETFVSIST